MAELNAKAKITLDKTGFDAALNAATKGMERFATGLTTQLAGAFSAAVVVSKVKEWVQSAVQAGDAIGDLSDRLGISVTDAQSFALAARMSGADVEFLAQKVERLRSFISKGGDLGIFGIKDAKGSVEALIAIADIIETTGLSAEQSAKFVEVFSKGSGKLINILGDLKTAQGAAKFSDSDVRSAQKLSDYWTLMANSMNVMLGNYLSEKWIKPISERFGSPQKPGGSTTPDDLERIRAAEAAEAERQRQIESDALGQMAIQDRILQLERDAADINEQSRIASLTDQERLLELKRQEKELQEKIALEVPVDEGNIFREAYYQMQKRLAEIGSERGSIERRLNKPSGVTAISSDEFGRIGAFTGGAGRQAQSDVARRQLGVLERLHAEMVNRGILIRGTD